MATSRASRIGPAKARITPAKSALAATPALLVKPSASTTPSSATPSRLRSAGPTTESDQRTAELLELGRAFRQVFRALSRLRGRDTHLAGSEVSHAQFELLIELFERGELPAGELAAAAQLTPATVTQMLDHLACSGHVERTRSQSDRRVVVSRLTAKGRRKVQAKRNAWQLRWEQALRDVEAGELSAATRVLERISTVFGEEPTDGGCTER